MSNKKLVKLDDVTTLAQRVGQAVRDLTRLASELQDQVDILTLENEQLREERRERKQEAKLAQF